MGKEIHYEKMFENFKVSNIYRNTNGSFYMLISKFTEDTFFMQNVKTKEYLVAIGVNKYKTYPKGEMPDKDNTETGIMWEHGRYLGNELIDIDMYSLKREYMAKNEIESFEDFYSDIREQFNDSLRIIKNFNVSEKIKNEVSNELYNKFETDELYEFENRLRDGLYDYMYFEIMRDKEQLGKKEKIYEITVTETLIRKEIVKADSLQDAKDKVMERYYEQDIVLDAEDFEGVIFEGKEVSLDRIKENDQKEINSSR